MSSSAGGSGTGPEPAPHGSDDVAFLCWMVRQTVTLALGVALFVNVLLCTWPFLSGDRGVPVALYYAYLFGAFALSMGNAFLTVGALRRAWHRAACARRGVRGGDTTQNLSKADRTAWAN